MACLAWRSSPPTWITRRRRQRRFSAPCTAGARAQRASPALARTPWSRLGGEQPNVVTLANTVVALPLLLTDAYHSKTDIPSVLRTAAPRPCRACRSVTASRSVRTRC